MIAVFVSIQVKPEFRDRFIEASLGDAVGSVRDEPGCFRFDILQDKTDPNRFHLYEIYADQAAREAHRKTPHYLKWQAEVKDWLDGASSRVECTTIFPTEDGLRKQKPYLVG